MTDAWKALTIERFESVTAGPSTALLRITGRPLRRRGAPQRPRLRVGHDQSIHRYLPIPAPPDPRRVLRAAYSVPLSLLGPETRFWLEHDDGSLTELPSPTSGTGPPDLAAELVEARRRAEQAEAANARLTATIDELEIWRAELERRLAAISTELGAANAAREQAELELRAAMRGSASDPGETP